jgi:predicted SnoaL-like aldol condensation-catalyzing enzyme
MAASPTATAVSFLERACRADTLDAAYDELLAPGFRHHNAWFRSDADSLRQGMAQNNAQFPQKKLVVQRTVEQGDLVAVYSHVRHTPDERGFALMHLFRFEGGRIAELWDIAQEVPAEMVNEIGMF